MSCRVLCLPRPGLTKAGTARGHCVPPNLQLTSHVSYCGMAWCDTRMPAKARHRDKFGNNTGCSADTGWLIVPYLLGWSPVSCWIHVHLWLLHQNHHFCLVIFQMLLLLFCVCSVLVKLWFKTEREVTFSDLNTDIQYFILERHVDTWYSITSWQ